MQKYLNRAEAAARVRNRGLPCSPLTLQKYATTGDGPKYHKFGGRVAYSEEAIDEWISERLGAAIRSSSEVA